MKHTKSYILILGLLSALGSIFGCGPIASDTADTISSAFDSPHNADPTVFDPLVAIEQEKFVLKAGVTKEQILALAKEHPEDALYSPASYIVATSEQVKETLGENPLPPPRLIYKEVVSRPSHIN